MHSEESQPFGGENYGPLEVGPFLRKEGLGVFGGAMAPAYFDEKTGDAAHHAAKECSALNIHISEWGLLGDFNLEKYSSSVLDGVIQFFGESFKIVISYQLESCLLHRVKMETAIKSVGESACKSVGDVVQDPVLVVAISGTEPAMKGLINFLAIHYTEVAGQKSIQSSFEPVVWYRNVEVDVDDLAIGVGATIGPTGADGFGFLAGYPANSFFQGALDSPLSKLCGPAAEVRPVVRDNELKASKFSRQVRAQRPGRHRLVGVRS